MFGGKTEYAISELRAAVAVGRRVRAYKHVIDNRYDPDHLVTHRNETFDALRVPDAESIAIDVFELTGGALGSEFERGELARPRADLVAIDEGHFFRMALIPVVEQLLAAGVSVIVIGITHDAWGRPFEPMPQLAAMADQVVLRQAPCRTCGTPAAYTQRLTRIDSLHMVGGLDDYEPRCREHFTPLPGPPEIR